MTCPDSGLTCLGMDVLVVGAGVIGLTTAVCLAECGARVRVWTAEWPRNTTSAAAGAVWGPVAVEPGFTWSLITRDELTTLTGIPGTGVRFCRGRELSDLSSALPPRAAEMAYLQAIPRDELSNGMLAGVWTTTLAIDLPTYLNYLTTRLAKVGVEIELRHVESLAETTAVASAVVNCTGVGASKLVGDHQLHAVRGQQVVVENPGLDEFYCEAGKAAEWASYIPHGESVVLGGVAMLDDWNRLPDDAVADGIIRRCAAIEPRLGTARVIEYRVGLRPHRSIPRLAAETIGEVRCVHNYGHGSMGVSMSWGAARAACVLL